MHLQQKDRDEKLHALCAAEGFESIEAILEAATFDSGQLGCRYTVTWPIVVAPLAHPQSISHRRFSLQPWPCASGASTCIRSGQRPGTTITIHVSRSVKARLATKLLLGFDEPSIFPVANRLTAEAASSILCSARQVFSAAPSGTTP